MGCRQGTGEATPRQRAGRRSGHLTNTSTPYLPCSQGQLRKSVFAGCLSLPPPSACYLIHLYVPRQYTTYPRATWDGGATTTPVSLPPPVGCHGCLPTLNLPATWASTEYGALQWCHPNLPLPPRAATGANLQFHHRQQTPTFTITTTNRRPFTTRAPAHRARLACPYFQRFRYHPFPPFAAPGLIPVAAPDRPQNLQSPQVLGAGGLARVRFCHSRPRSDSNLCAASSHQQSPSHDAGRYRLLK